MRKFVYRRILILSALIASICGGGLLIKNYEEERENQRVSSKIQGEERLIPGGTPIGIYMETDGVLVLDTEEIEDVNGKKCEPAKNLIKAGDYITAINDAAVETKMDLIQAVSALHDSKVVLNVRRAGTNFVVKFDSVEVEDDSYKLGIWVRDSIQGLGTITYLTSQNEFGALGHGIHDADTESMIEIDEGRIYDVNVVGIQKGEKGAPGGMEGVIVYNRNNILGAIEENTECGIYGIIENTEELFADQEAIEICKKKEIKLGKATILSAVTGTLREYDIEIMSVDYFTRNENKGIVIKIIDEELVKQTGGIVQGMSGSPIIQDGKLVGAVTHVLVNDPTRGYGIFIENMLDAAG